MYKEAIIILDEAPLITYCVLLAHRAFFIKFVVLNTNLYYVFGF